jgi:2-C-methyl-D-erythritol 2,4-cyclodiphosphate synthase
MSGRVGLGYDIHRLVIGRPLVLGGLTLPWDLGLEGHSDADPVCHALTDALLGAAGLPDIGTLFPDDDDRFKDASSLDLLRDCAQRVRERGFTVVNCDVTLVLEVPRLKPYREEVVANLANALGVGPEQVSIKAKTNERLGPVGAGEAIACMAVVLLESA